ncbi:hypothetical protein BW730_12420 [Tessaracoccus aquimaris]|uniref:HTH tetR-type domain-containing protein n=1 Tax=Tessaracoccus aquimaris TaxID=1332264 RepID=A0A1Q2CQ03_9ACTN|nr:TetR/AcrR family transcriptional regulator [Tessaracoccus aquimaris]AQP48183.1 hypothetical protein BW730_12420 [Tessaracoccus aquimaris]
MNRSARSQATADALLDAALDLIGECGLRGTTTRAIAERAGVNEVTLFRKFGSKSKLVREAISARFATLTADAITHTGDLEADLVRLTSAYHAALEGFGPVARAVLTEVPFDEEVAVALEGLRAVIEAIGGLLRTYQAEGLLAEEPLETQIPALLGPIVMPIVTGGYALVPSLGEAPFDAARHVDRFLHGHAKTD